MNKEVLAALEAEWNAQGGQAKGRRAPNNQPKRLTIRSIELLPTLYQARGAHHSTSGVVDQKHVASLLAALRGQKNKDLDAVTVLRVGDRNILIDGHHRLAAYRAQNRKDIPVAYFCGSPTDALLEAGRENGKARLQMSKAQCSERAWALVSTACRWSANKIAGGSGIHERTVWMMKARYREFLAAGEDIPTSWRDANRRAFNADPEAIPKLVAEWAAAIGSALPPPSTFNPGKVEILGDALIRWSEPLAVLLTRHLVASLDLLDEAEAMQELRSAENAEFAHLEF